MNVLTEAERVAVRDATRRASASGEMVRESIEQILDIIERLEDAAQPNAVHVDPLTAGGIDEQGRVFLQFPNVGTVTFTSTDTVRDLCVALGALAADADHYQSTGERL